MANQSDSTSLTALAHEFGEQLNAHLPANAEPLQYWQMQFAEWLVTLPTQKPAKSLLTFQASEFAGREVTWAELTSVRRRDVFREYQRAVAAMPMSAARAKAQKLVLEGVDLHRLGAKLAAQAKDYKAIYNYSVPLLDRALPKKEEQFQAQQVQIQLTVKQANLLDDPVIEISHEVLPPFRGEPGPEP